MFKKASLATALLLSLFAVHYFVPQTDVVRAVGVETKRVDADGTPANDGIGNTRDVYFLQTEDVKNSSPMVYRNEDNLLYLKWNSADVQARANSLSSDKQVVAVSHYGWRIPLFSAFPNALSVKPVDPGYSSTPYAFYIILLLVWGSILLLFRKLQKFGRNRAVPISSTSVASSQSGSNLDDFLGDTGSDIGGSD